MRIVILTLLHLLIFLAQNHAEDVELTCKLVDRDTEVPIAYATILMLDNADVGAVSNREGIFKLRYPSNTAEAKFYISVLGYADTTIVLNSSNIGNGVLRIALRSEVPTLDTILVKGVKPELYSTGLKREKYKIAFQKGGSPDLFGINREGEMMGNHFELGKSKIENLTIYFYKHEKLTDKCLVRLFSSNEEVIASRDKPFSDLNEIGNEQIVVDIDSTGYKTINLKGYNIIHDGKYLIVLVLPYFPPESDFLKYFPLAIINNRQKDVSLVYATKGNSYTVFRGRVGSFLIEVDYLKLDDE